MFRNDVINSLLIESGKFCKVTFKTKDGRISSVHGRTGVHKFIKGTGSKRKSKTKLDYILFWDIHKGYRNIKRSNIISINAHHVGLEVR